MSATKALRNGETALTRPGGAAVLSLGIHLQGFRQGSIANNVLGRTGNRAPTFSYAVAKRASCQLVPLVLSAATTRHVSALGTPAPEGVEPVLRLPAEHPARPVTAIAIMG